MNEQIKKWDAFISHANEDKDEIARPLAERLRSFGLRVLFDEFSLKVGDSLCKSVDYGLANSQFGVVILSKYFFSKQWPRLELAGLVARAVGLPEKVILPVWHRVTKNYIFNISPALADLAAISTDRGIDHVAAELNEMIKPYKLGSLDSSWERGRRESGIDSVVGLGIESIEHKTEIVDHHLWRQARDQFITLFNNRDSLEKEWQKLFTDFPFILTECLPLGIEPHQLIPCKPGRAEADFYFFPETQDPLSPYGVIEIKRPKTRILRSTRKDVIRLSSGVDDAVGQAQKYATEIKAKVVKLSSQLLVLGDALTMFIIAGLSKEFAKKVTTDLLRSQVERLMPPACKLVPYDELLRRLTSRVPPRIYVLVPWYPEASLSQSESTMKRSPGSRDFGSLDFGTRDLWAAICTECGKELRVPFEPGEGKSIYCRDCYSRRRPRRW